jgi:hypothetical protein
MFRIISALIPGWFIRINCRLLNSTYLWAARGAYNEEEEREQ